MNHAARVVQMRDCCDDVEAMSCLDRARGRGFPMFMLCLNEGADAAPGARSAPLAVVASDISDDLVQEWTAVRHAQDPFRRLLANGDLDRNLTKPLVWGNEHGRISLPAARTTSAEVEMMQLAYARGIRTGVNVPMTVGGTAAKVIASFYSDVPLARLADLEDSVAILFYLSHRLHAVLASQLTVAPRAAGGLSPRETECLEWVAKGKNSSEIAVILNLSVGTVRDHIKSLRAKLGASTRAEAIARAMALGHISRRM